MTSKHKADLRDVTIFALIILAAALACIILATGCQATQPAFEGTTNMDSLTLSGNLSAVNGSFSDDLTVTDDTTISGDLTVAGYVYGKIAPSAKTADYTITTSDIGKLFTNAGASGAITFTLPTAAAGLNYCFYTYAAQTLGIDPSSGDQIYHLTNSAGDMITNGTAGDHVCLSALDTTNWLGWVEHGTWNDAD